MQMCFQERKSVTRRASLRVRANNQRKTEIDLPYLRACRHRNRDRQRSSD
jgi:hypothetical protein